MTEGKLLYSFTGPSAGLNVRMQRWRWPSKFRKGGRRPFHRILLFAPGARIDASIEDRRGRTDAADNRIAIVPAGMECALQMEAPVEEFTVLHVDPAPLSNMALANGAARLELADVIGQEDEILHHLYQALASTTEESGAPALLLWDSVCHAIFARVLSRYSRHSLTAPGRLSGVALARTITYVNENLGGDITLVSMAKVAGLSPFHFSRLFAEVTGHPPHAYVMMARVERAVALIRGSRLSLAEIAYRTGFADQSHLARHVRRVHGVSPRSMRDKR